MKASMATIKLPTIVEDYRWQKTSSAVSARENKPSTVSFSATNILNLHMTKYQQTVNHEVHEVVLGHLAG
jgi:hypothetical protein